MERGGQLGGLVHFPRTAARRSEAEWHDPAENALRSTKSGDASLVTWIDAKRSRDGDDDGDGSGGRAA